jgi:hypothetical protein
MCSASPPARHDGTSSVRPRRAGEDALHCRLREPELLTERGLGDAASRVGVPHLNHVQAGHARGMVALASWRQPHSGSVSGVLFGCAPLQVLDAVVGLDSVPVVDVRPVVRVRDERGAHNAMDADVLCGRPILRLKQHREVSVAIDRSSCSLAFAVRASTPRRHLPDKPAGRDFVHTLVPMNLLPHIYLQSTDYVCVVGRKASAI